MQIMRRMWKIIDIKICCQLQFIKSKPLVQNK